MKKDPNLSKWIENNISTPNSMVDRITPRFKDDIYDRLENNVIQNDNVPVSCEEFSQWVIEDNFITPRPKLEKWEFNLLMMSYLMKKQNSCLKC
ncbi:hypothetical protein [Sodalis ligni]|uniref:hypothetical protein n=1 Tax=Sodalis ligni TaxID=2697027 RepID=UPI0020975DE1|nr:hypothetical protein [Sodalis ligni]